MKNLNVVGVFHDDISGSLTQRPGMQEMLAFIRKQRGQEVAVIIDDVSRLARDIEAHIALRKLIMRAGGILLSPSIEFGEDPDSIIIERMQALFSEFQRLKNGQQTKHRMAARTSNGYFCFQAPVGYRYESVPGRGQMLKRDEPAASAVQEALEGFASGKLETQADVMRFLQNNPLFPKDGSGIVRNMRVTQILNQCVYAGFVSAPSWGIPMREGQHEGLVSAETFQRIQERLKGNNRLAKRTNRNTEFPLRGFVVCGDCGTPLTACFSTGKFNRYAYYLCPNKRECPSYGKSIKRETLETQFETLLKSVEPTKATFKVARAMFEAHWNHGLAQTESQRKGIAAKISQVEREVTQLLARIVETEVPSVIAAYEGRIGKLELKKAALKERMQAIGKPSRTFDEALRNSLQFLSTPWQWWASGGLEQRRAVLKLTFVRRLRYSRNNGFLETDFSLPFKVLTHLAGCTSEMARPKRFELLTF